jgi:uncharacterized protein (TIGR03435 family)
MLATIVRSGMVVFTCCLALGQTVDKTLTFEVASIKPAPPPVPDGRGRIMIAGPSGGPGTKDPGRIHYPFMSLKNLLMSAYDVKNFQISGPPWLDTERFDITATMPPETTKEQFRVMLQNLLAERFKLTIHRETKDLPMYSLLVAKGGPKMTESAPPAPPKEGDDAPPPPPPSRPKIGADGFPELPAAITGRAGIFNMMMPGRGRMIGSQQTMHDLADRLSGQLSRPVTDETELAKKYDFTLTYSTEGLSMMGPMGPMPPPGGGGGGVAVAVAGPAGGGGGGAGGGGTPAASQPEAEAPPDIFHAIQAQLGLRLESKKGPVELIVIDHMEKTATDN